MPTLFEIGEDLRAFDALLDGLDNGEVPDAEVEAALDAFMAELRDNQAVKLDGYCNLIRREEGVAAVAKATADQFTMKARTAENRAKRLKDRLHAFLAFTGQKKAESVGGWVVSVVANGGALPVKLAEGLDPKTLPEQFQRITVVPDTAAIGKAIAAGEEFDFAKLGERGNHLRIR